MRVVYLGTPEWAVPGLRALVRSDHQVVGVVTAPDKARGRSRKLQPSPVKLAALEEGIEPILQPTTLRPQSARDQILDLDADGFVVVAYGRILPGRLLDAPRHGAINVHFSLLPRYRGASPVQHAVLNGDSVTGITTMRMARGLDTGPILLTEEMVIGAEETAPDLGERLADASGPLLVRTLDGLEQGRITAQEQGEEGVSWAPILTREMGRVDWTRTAEEISQQVRAFSGWPRVTARCAKGLFQIRRALPVGADVPSDKSVGTLVRKIGEAVEVVCGQESLLRIDRVQPAGKREMSAGAALAGRFFQLGEVFSSPAADDQDS